MPAHLLRRRPLLRSLESDCEKRPARGVATSCLRYQAFHLTRRGHQKKEEHLNKTSSGWRKPQDSIHPVPGVVRRIVPQADSMGAAIVWIEGPQMDQQLRPRQTVAVEVIPRGLMKGDISISEITFCARMR